MQGKKFEQDIISQELIEAAELIRSPDIEVRQIGARMLARIALNAVETESGSMGLVRVLDTAGVDNAEFLNTEEKDKKSLEIHRSLIEGINDIFFTLDLDGNLSFINSAIKNISGYDSEDLLGLSFDTFIYPDDLPSLTTKFKETLVGKNKPFEFRVIDKDNAIRWMRASTNILMENGRPSGIAGLLMDITDRKDLEDKLKEMVLIDPLTKLYSRHHYDEQLDILRSSRGYPISIINIDVDGLRDVNNNYGHHAGDELLRHVGVILKDVFRPEDCVARTGGDEFVILLPKTDEADVEGVLGRIKERLSEHNDEKQISPLSFSVGTATSYDITTFDMALKDADERMYDEKRIHDNDRKH